MENLSKKQWVILTLIIIVIIIVVGYYLFTNFQQIGYENLEEEFENDMVENEIIQQEEKEETILVHIAGAVKKEGVVTLEEGTRIVDAINEAGGLDENADLSNVNLAYMISDGQKIYIPYIGEEASISNENGKNIIQGNTEENNSTNSLVNINTANLSELLELPGIGSSTAQKIINYRTENGSFNSIEDIKNVSGIGDSKFENIKNYITVK